MIITTATQPPAAIAEIKAFVPAIIALTAATVALAAAFIVATVALAVAFAACAAVLAELFHFNSLRQRRGAVLTFHCVVQRLLLVFGKIGQLHGRTESNLSVIHHLQDRRDQFGQADKAINLRLAVSTFLT